MRRNRWPRHTPNMKPLPIIHLTNPLDHTRLIRALYPLGWSYSSQASADDGVDDYLDDVVRDGQLKYPYLALDTQGQITAFLNLSQPWRRRGFTVMNSPAHFLAYTKTLGPASDVLDQEDDTDYDDEWVYNPDTDTYADEAT